MIMLSKKRRKRDQSSSCVVVHVPYTCVRTVPYMYTCSMYDSYVHTYYMYIIYMYGTRYTGTIKLFLIENIPKKSGTKTGNNQALKQVIIR